MKNTLKVTAIVALALIVGGAYGLAATVHADNNGQGEGENGNGNSMMPLLAPGQNGTAPGLGIFNGENENNGLGINAPAGMTIGANGAVRVTAAKVTGINGSTMTVSLFGLSLSVDTSQAQIIGGIVLPPISTTTPSTTTSTPTVGQTQVSIGDLVSVNGTMNQTSGVIQAQTVRDLTVQSQSTSNIQSRIQQLLQLIQQLRAQLQGGGN